MSLQGKSKSRLRVLYDCTIDEDEKVYTYNDFKFYFIGTNFVNSEKLVLNVVIPMEKIGLSKIKKEDLIPIEHYVLGLLAKPINELSRSFRNQAKSIREKAQFFAQDINELVIKRSGLCYKKDIGFVLKIAFNVPLIDALSINAKSCFKAVKDVLDLISKTFSNFNCFELKKIINLYQTQEMIRKFLEDNDYILFIGNGSILPREKSFSQFPKKDAIPFISCKSLEISIPINNNIIKGMGIKKGITVITGGGYSGKTTLLDAIEMGIYNHQLNDGREYVISNRSLLKIYAEDGRVCNNVNIKPYFKKIPGNSNLKKFFSLHASGSVSQATNVVEAINMGCRVFLIDEDKTATNFMIKDNYMREVVRNDPIIPFTDRLKELKEMGVSVVLVIGGSSEYFKYADTILLMDNFVCKNISKKIYCDFKNDYVLIKKISWKSNRYLCYEKPINDFLYLKEIKIRDKVIILDKYICDLSMLTNINSIYQVNSLALLLERVLVSGIDELRIEEVCKRIINSVFKNNEFINSSFLIDFDFCFFEEVRLIDLIYCLNRCYGLKFK